MSNTGKWLAGIIIVVLIAGGIWWWSMTGSQGTGSTALNTYGTQPQPAPAAPAPTPSAPQGVTNTDNSDQAIQQDMTSANAQMNAFSSDSASINQGMSDQPVQQSQL